MIRILIADDHPIVRRGLKQILSDEPDMAVPGEASDANEVLSLLQKGDWDIVILDITMPGRSGLDVLKELRQKYPRLPVLVLSIHPEGQYAVRALKTGAAGYLTKESAPEELVKAIRKILNRGKYVSASLAERLAFRSRNRRRQGPASSPFQSGISGHAVDCRGQTIERHSLGDGTERKNHQHVSKQNSGENEFQE